MSVRLFSLLHVFLLLDGANPIYAANPVRKAGFYFLFIGQVCGHQSVEGPVCGPVC